MADLARSFELFERILELRSAPAAGPEPRLLRMLDLLRLIFRSGRLGTWVYDVATGWLGWDRTLLEIYGLREEEFDNDFATWERAVYPPDLEPAKIALQAFLERDDSDPIVFRILRPDGEMRWVEGWAVAQRDAAGELVAMFGVNRDITDAHVMEERAARAERLEALEALVARASRDLDRVLVQLERDVADTAQRHAVQRLRDVGGDLRGVEPLDGDLPGLPEMEPMLAEFEASLRRYLPENVLLRVRAEPGLPDIAVDHGRLDRATLALALSAREVMPEGGLLTLDARAEMVEFAKQREDGMRLAPGRYIRLSVKDSRTGTMSENLRRATRPLWPEGREGTSRRLAGVLDFARSCHGAVRVESTPGSGILVDLFLSAN